MVNPTILDNENSFNDNNLQRLFNQKLDLEEILKEFMKNPSDNKDELTDVLDLLEPINQEIQRITTTNPESIANQPIEEEIEPIADQPAEEEIESQTNNHLEWSNQAFRARLRLLNPEAQ